MIDKLTRRTCHRKRQRGNVYLSERAAELAAASMSLTTGDCIRAFKCRVCAHWHIGGDRRFKGKQR